MYIYNRKLHDFDENRRFAEVENSGSKELEEFVRLRLERERER